MTSKGPKNIRWEETWGQRPTSRGSSQPSSQGRSRPSSQGSSRPKQRAIEEEGPSYLASTLDWAKTSVSRFGNYLPAIQRNARSEGEGASDRRSQALALASSLALRMPKMPKMPEGLLSLGGLQRPQSTGPEQEPPVRQGPRSLVERRHELDMKSTPALPSRREVTPPGLIGVLESALAAAPEAPPVAPPDEPEPMPLGTQLTHSFSDLPSLEDSEGGDLARDIQEVMRELHHAALCDDAARIRRLLVGQRIDGRRISADLVDIDGQTPALRAAQQGRLRSCAALLDCKADPLARDLCPRFFGDGSGIWPGERRLDPYGSTKRAGEGSRSGRTVIYFLRLGGWLDEVLSQVFPLTRVAIVQEIADSLTISHHEPALVLAARCGYRELAAMLLTHAGQLSKPAKCKKCAGSLQRSEAADKCCSVCSKMGTKLSCAKQECDFHTCDEHFKASGAALRSSSKGALSRGASRDGFFERAQAVLQACIAREWRCVEVLLAAGVASNQLDVTRDQLGRTSVHLAALAGEASIVRALMAAGASFAVYSRSGRQPLHDACYAGHAEAVAVLLDAGASLSAPVVAHALCADSEVGLTPLELAHAKKRGSVLALLHERGGLRCV